MIYPLPVFAEFEIETDNFFCPASSTAYKKVIFHLVNGVDSIECEMRAKRKVEQFEVCNDGDVQNSVDRDFEYLEVDCETEVLVELDCVQKIKLTEKQMLKLNEYLKDEMKMIGDGVMDNKLEPQEIVRSEMGTWTHSVYADHMNSTFGDKEFATKDEWEAFKNSLSIETVTLWMESSVNPDDWEIMMDACDISKWNPIAPNGFFLIDINFSEDDAYVIFARNKHESEMA